MRASYGGVWLYGLVITFVLFFVAFLSITSNYSRAFRLKNEIIDFIEREEGMTNTMASATKPGGGAIQLINNYLIQYGYAGRGRCDEGWFGMADLSYSNAEGPIESGNNKIYYYCFKKTSGFESTNMNKAYYEINVFFNLDIPVLGDLLNLKVTGTSIPIEYPADTYNMWGNSGYASSPPATPAPTYYVVTYNSNGGSGVDSEIVAKGNGAPYKMSTKPDNTLEGWYTDSALTVKYNNGAIMGNTTLYAKWVELVTTPPTTTYTVSFNTNGGGTIIGQNVTSGGVATRPVSPTKSGSTFDDWYTTSALTTRYNFSTPVTSNITLYAKWVVASEFKLLSVTPLGGTLTKPFGSTTTVIFIGSVPGSPSIKLNFNKPVQSLSYNVRMSTCAGFNSTLVDDARKGLVATPNGNDVQIPLVNKDGRREPASECWTEAWFEEYEIDAVSTSGDRLKITLDKNFAVLYIGSLEICDGFVQYEIPGERNC